MRPLATFLAWLALGAGFVFAFSRALEFYLTSPK